LHGTRAAHSARARRAKLRRHPAMDRVPARRPLLRGGGATPPGRGAPRVLPPLPSDPTLERSRAEVTEQAGSLPEAQEAPMPESPRVTQDRVEGYFKDLNNWGRWGVDDQRGTLNLITPSRRADALRLIRTGRPASLARDVIPRPVYMYHVT